MDDLINLKCYGRRSLEYHIVHSCNFACDGCSHWTDVYNLKGAVSPQTYYEETKYWIDRITNLGYYYTYHNVLGGEPLMHPKLISVLEYAVSIFKDIPTGVRLGTNGLLWNKHPKLMEFILDNNIHLKVSIHSSDKQYHKRLLPVLNDMKKYKLNTEVFQNSVSPWAIRRHPDLSPIAIIDDKEAYDACGQKQCHQLYQNKLHKCPHVAYMPMEKVNKIYIDYMKTYNPLEFGCSDEELLQFLKKKEEPICSTCSYLIVNKKTVKDKVNNINY